MAELDDMEINWLCVGVSFTVMFFLMIFAIIMWIAGRKKTARHTELQALINTLWTALGEYVDDVNVALIRERLTTLKARVDILTDCPDTTNTNITQVAESMDSRLYNAINIARTQTYDQWTDALNASETRTAEALNDGAQNTFKVLQDPCLGI
ncbi:Fc.00g107380.m01.CDS01 [Cosmosporella sp. VM-42]